MFKVRVQVGINVCFLSRLLDDFWYHVTSYTDERVKIDPIATYVHQLIHATLYGMANLLKAILYFHCMYMWVTSDVKCVYISSYQILLALVSLQKEAHNFLMIGPPDLKQNLSTYSQWYKIE